MAIVSCVGAFTRYEPPASDPDRYLALEGAVWSQQQFGDGEGTAFRPPGYPLLLVLTGPLPYWWVNGVLLLWAVYAVQAGGEKFGPPWVAAVAAVGVIASPLLLRYVTLPMTEVTSAFLCAALLASASRRPAERGSEEAAFGTGGLLGLAILTRPVFAAFGLLWGGWVLGRWFVTRRAAYRPRLNGAGAFLLGLALVWSPWVVRNALVFDAFIPFTTHGGYTLLLGNNPVFWDEVARVSPFETWDGESLDRWQQSLETEMAAEGVAGEVARDRWVRARAIGHIVERPGDFLRGVGVRVVRFWCPVPLGYEGSPLITWGVGIYETAFLSLAVLGAVVLVRSRPPSLWMPAVLMVAAFQGVHLFYWANARMRAPLVPVLAVFAAVGLRAAWLFFKPMLFKHLGRSEAADAA